MNIFCLLFAALLAFPGWDLPLRDSLNRGHFFPWDAHFAKPQKDPARACNANNRPPGAALAQVDFNQGLVLFEKGRYEQAIQAFTRALKKNPDSTKAYFGRAQAWKKAGDYQKAISDYGQAIQISPKYFKAFTERGVLLHEIGEYDRALEDFNQAIEIAPDKGGGYLLRGMVWHQKKNHERAIADFNKTLEFAPKFTQVYYHRAKAYYSNKDYAKAIDDFRQTLKHYPEDAKIYNLLAWVLCTCPVEEHRNGEEAVRLALVAVSKKPEAPHMQDTLAAAYGETGDFEKAVATQEKAIDLLNKGKDPNKRLPEYQKRLQFYQSSKPWRED